MASQIKHYTLLPNNPVGRNIKIRIKINDIPKTKLIENNIQKSEEKKIENRIFIEKINSINDFVLSYF